MNLSEVLVTLNAVTILAAVLSGYLLGRVVVRDLVATSLRRVLLLVEVEKVIELVPLLLLLVGIPVVVTFYTTQLLVDLESNSPNVRERLIGRGIGHLIFLMFVAVGTWHDVARERNRRKAP